MKGQITTVEKIKKILSLNKKNSHLKEKLEEKKNCEGNILFREANFYSKYDENNVKSELIKTNAEKEKAEIRKKSYEVFGLIENETTDFEPYEKYKKERLKSIKKLYKDGFLSLLIAFLSIAISLFVVMSPSVFADDFRGTPMLFVLALFVTVFAIAILVASISFGELKQAIPNFREIEVHIKNIKDYPESELFKKHTKEFFKKNEAFITKEKERLQKQRIEYEETQKTIEKEINKIEKEIINNDKTIKLLEEDSDVNEIINIVLKLKEHKETENQSYNSDFSSNNHIQTLNNSNQTMTRSLNTNNLALNTMVAAGTFGGGFR